MRYAPIPDESAIPAPIIHSTSRDPKVSLCGKIIRGTKHTGTVNPLHVTCPECRTIYWKDVGTQWKGKLDRV